MAGWLGEHDDAHGGEERGHDYLAEVSGLAFGIGEVHLCESSMGSVQQRLQTQPP